MTTNYCGSTSYLLHIYIISQGRRLTPTGFNVFLQQSGWRDSNPHTIIWYQILSLVCLPVPAHPGSQGFTLLTYESPVTYTGGLNVSAISSLHWLVYIMISFLFRCWSFILSSFTLINTSYLTLNLGGAEWGWTTAHGFSVHCTITTYTTAPFCTGNGIRTPVTCLKGTSPRRLAYIPAFIF